MADAVQIHVISIGDLRADIPPPWQDTLKVAALTPQKRACMLANPLIESDLEPAQVIAVQGGQAVGRLDLIRGRIDAPGGAVPMYWGSDWFVPVEMRSTMVGLMVMLKAGQFRTNLGAHGPSQLAVPIYQKLNWTDIPVQRWVLIRRSRAVLERFLGVGFHTRLGAMILDAGLWIHGKGVALAIALATRALRATVSDTCPTEFDSLYNPPPGLASCHRSSAFINWTLSHSFGDDPRNRKRLLLVRTRDGRLVATATVKRRFYPIASARGFKNLLLGSVHDWVILDPAAADERRVVLLAVEQLRTMGVDAIEVCVNDPALTKFLRRLGFRGSGAMHFLFKPAAGDTLAGPAFTNGGGWFIRPGDGDNIFV